MPCPDWGKVFDLVAATGAGSDHDSAKRLGMHLLHKRLGYLERQFIFGCEGAERARHTATSSVQQVHAPAMQSAGQALHERSFHERFGVAMGMNNHIDRLGIEFERMRLVFEKVFDEMFEENATRRYLISARKVQLAVIFHEHRITGRLKKKYRGIVCVVMEQGEIVLPEAERLIEVPLTERRAATTFPVPDDFDLEASGLKNFDGSEANVRFVVTDEGVIPKNHTTPGRNMIRGALPKPFIESAPRVMRQGTLPGEAQKLFEQAAHKD